MGWTELSPAQGEALFKNQLNFLKFILHLDHSFPSPLLTFPLFTPPLTPLQLSSTSVQKGAGLT